MTTILTLLVTLIVPWTIQAQAPVSTDGPAIPTIPDVNPEILRLVAEDQWDRGHDMFTGRQVRPPDSLDWEAVARRDAERQAAIRALLADGHIQSAGDYRFAALIFQHSAKRENLALAHILASTAVAKGGPAKWLAAATLDRYLHALEQPQVFGTQFIAGDQGAWTMEPYDQTAVSDRLRAEWCVIPVDEQRRILEDLRKGGPLRPTSLPECR